MPGGNLFKAGVRLDEEGSFPDFVAFGDARNALAGRLSPAGQTPEYNMPSLPPFCFARPIYRQGILTFFPEGDPAFSANRLSGRP